MHPIEFDFQVTEITDEHFIRIRPRDSIGYFFLRETWVPKNCLEVSPEAPMIWEYRERTRWMNVCAWQIKEQKLTYRDDRVSYADRVALSNSPGSIKCATNDGNMCVKLEELGSMAKVRFFNPILCGEMYVSLNDVFLHYAAKGYATDPGDVVEFWYCDPLSTEHQNQLV